MRPLLTAGALALATAAFAFADARPASAAQQPGQAAAPATAPAQRKISISKEAQKPIGELQAAVTANDVANISRQARRRAGGRQIGR